MFPFLNYPRIWCNFGKVSERQLTFLSTVYSKPRQLKSKKKTFDSDSGLVEKTPFYSPSNSPIKSETYSFSIFASLLYQTSLANTIWIL